MTLVREQIKELPPSLLLIYAQLIEQVSNPLPVVKDAMFLRREVEGKHYWIRRACTEDTPGSARAKSRCMGWQLYHGDGDEYARPVGHECRPL